MSEVWVEARGAFSAQSASELSFPKAALIRVLEENDSGWWLGELDTPSGKKQGYFPSNFTKPAVRPSTSVAPPSSSSAGASSAAANGRAGYTQPGSSAAPASGSSNQQGGRTASSASSSATAPGGDALYKVVRSFTGNAAHQELSLAVGELVVVTQRYENGWWIGTCNGKRGAFPHYCVEENRAVGGTQASAQSSVGPASSAQPPASVAHTAAPAASVARTTSSGGYEGEEVAEVLCDFTASYVFAEA